MYHLCVQTLTSSAVKILSQRPAVKTLPSPQSCHDDSPVLSLKGRRSQAGLIHIPPESRDRRGNHMTPAEQ